MRWNEVSDTGIVIQLDLLLAFWQYVRRRDHLLPDRGWLQGNGNCRQGGLLSQENNGSESSLLKLFTFLNIKLIRQIQIPLSEFKGGLCVTLPSPLKFPAFSSTSRPDFQCLQNSLANSHPCLCLHGSLRLSGKMMYEWRVRETSSFMGWVFLGNLFSVPELCEGGFILTDGSIVLSLSESQLYTQEPCDLVSLI